MVSEEVEFRVGYLCSFQACVWGRERERERDIYICIERDGLHGE